MDKPSMRVLSLCTGIGGIDLAAEMTGHMRIVGQVELDPFCNAVLAHHWPDVKRMRDLKEVHGDEFGTIDLVVAGFPCQPASHAGKRRGQADDRWLWPDVDRIIRCARPAWVLLENVAGLISLGLDNVLSDLERTGYTAAACVYPASAVGAPHQRERVFIVGHTYSTNRQTGNIPACQPVARQPCRATSAHDVAHTRCARQSRRRHAGRCTAVGEVGDTWVRDSGESLADTTSSTRCGWPQWNRGLTLAGDAPVEYASSTGQQERDISRVAGDAGHATGRCDTNGCIGQAQSSVGIAVDGLPGWLAGYSITQPRWPSGPDHAQHDWEAPRTVPASDRTAQRAAKLKALGNAVVPAQVYPVLAAIAETWQQQMI